MSWLRTKIPIQFLCALEKAVGLDMPIQEHFDLAYPPPSIDSTRKPAVAGFVRTVAWQDWEQKGQQSNV
jgi:hypothetical protein